jgi:hypothetical protein
MTPTVNYPANNFNQVFVWSPKIALKLVEKAKTQQRNEAICRMGSNDVHAVIPLYKKKRSKQ